MISCTSTHVLKVVDGDTIKVSYQGREETVRLIGVDTPESKNNRKARKDAARSGDDIKTIIEHGKKAAVYTESLVPNGTNIRLEFDVQERDRYRRLLAYVWLADGRMLNEVLLMDGYASIMTIPPNVKYVERFKRAIGR